MVTYLLANIFLLLLPTQLGKFFFMDFSFINGVRIDYLAPAIYLTDLIVIALVIFNIKVLIPFFKTKWAVITFIFVCLNILFSLSQPIAAYKWVKVLEIFFVFLIFKNHKIENEKVLISLLAGTLIEFSLATLQFMLKQSIQGIYYFLGERAMSLGTPDIAKASLNGVEILRPYATFSHPNSMGGFYLLLYFFVLTNKKFDQYKLYKTLTLLFSTLLIFLSFSKIVITAFIIFNIVWIWINKKEQNCLLCTFSKLSVFGVLAFLFMSANGDPLSGEKRLTLIKNAWTIFTQYPFFGVGLGNYLIAQSQFPIKYSYHFLQPVHNIFLLILSETGIIFSGLLMFWSIKILQLFRKNKAFLIMAGVITFTGLFDHYWLTLQQNMLLLPVVFALLNKEKV